MKRVFGTVNISLFLLGLVLLCGACARKDDVILKQNTIELSQEAEPVNDNETPSSDNSYVIGSIYLVSGCYICCGEPYAQSIVIYNVDTHHQEYVSLPEDSDGYEIPEAGFYLVYKFADGKMIDITDKLSIDNPAPFVIERAR